MPTGASRLRRMLDELGRVSDERGRLTRTFLSPAMRRANRLVGGWMRSAGLVVREDAAGNLIGRLAAGIEPGRRAGATTHTPTLLLGSHLDTVRDAGRFDGALGVLLPIVAIAELRRRRVKLPFHVEVLGFSEEEGVRFSSAYLGSKAYAGRLRAADLRLRDGEGITVRGAMQRWNATSPRLRPAGFDVAQSYARSETGTRAAGRSKRAGDIALHLSRWPDRKGGVLGYIEVHIEQGPVLENEKLAVGVVSAIAGQTRGKLIFRGEAGHAGTTPMALRRDALAGAAECMLLAEAVARRVPSLVATVGTVSVSPGAPNVIPAEAVLSLDFRHPRDAVRRRALRGLIAGAKTIARHRRLGCTWVVTQDDDAVQCSPHVTGMLERSVKAVQGRSLTLVSGAGHDGVVMSAVAPVAMLFVRCRRGLSHHPDEYASPADLKVALRVMVDFLGRLGHATTPEQGSRGFRG